jgi:hypothetical protein
VSSQTTQETRTITLTLSESEAWQLRRAAQRECAALEKMIARCEKNGWSAASLLRQFEEYDALAAKITIELAGEQMPLFHVVQGGES